MSLLTYLVTSPGTLGFWFWSDLHHLIVLNPEWRLKPARNLQLKVRIFLTQRNECMALSRACHGPLHLQAGPSTHTPSLPPRVHLPWMHLATSRLCPFHGSLSWFPFMTQDLADRAHCQVSLLPPARIILSSSRIFPSHSFLHQTFSNIKETVRQRKVLEFLEAKGGNNPNIHQLMNR